MRGNKKTQDAFKKFVRLWEAAGRDGKKLTAAWDQIRRDAAKLPGRDVTLETLWNANKLDVPKFAPPKTPCPALELLKQAQFKPEDELLREISRLGARFESPKLKVACLTLLAARFQNLREILKRLPAPKDKRLEGLLSADDAVELCEVFEKNLLTRWVAPLEDGLFYGEDSRLCVLAHPLLVGKRVFDAFGKDKVERAKDYLDLVRRTPEDKLAHHWLSDMARVHSAVGNKPLLDLAQFAASVISGREHLQLGTYRAKLVADDLTLLRGMILAGAFVMTPELAELYIDAATSLPLCVDAIWLSDVPNRVWALGMIKVKSRNPNTTKRAAEAMRQIAEQSKIPQEQVEDLAVDTCGLDANGRRTWKAGEYKLTLTLSKGGMPVVFAQSGNDRRLPRVPKAIEGSQEMLDAQQLCKRVGQIVTKQRARLEEAMMAQRTWTPESWDTVFLKHPIMKSLATRLLWTWKSRTRVFTAWYSAENGRFEDTKGRVLIPVGEISVAHPALVELRELHEWQTWVVQKSVVQPFNQLFREVYLPELSESDGTKTERWSGLVALHESATTLLRARGWEGGIVGLNWDGSDEERFFRRDFEWCGLRAVAEIEAIAPSTPMQIVVKDLSFYPVGAHARAPGSAGVPIPRRSERTKSVPPLPLSAVPTVAYSEAARDLDALASQVGAAERALRRYCQQEGEPEPRFYAAVIGWYERVHPEIAEANRQYLEALVARLKLAPRVTFTGRFATVRGKIGRYRVHLGTGHTYVEPHGPMVEIPVKTADVDYLPFDGSHEALPALVSKILTLIDDADIDDPKFKAAVLACAEEAA